MNEIIKQLRELYKIVVSDTSKDSIRHVIASLKKTEYMMDSTKLESIYKIVQQCHVIYRNDDQLSRLLSQILGITHAVENSFQSVDYRHLNRQKRLRYILQKIDIESRNADTQEEKKMAYRAATELKTVMMKLTDREVDRIFGLLRADEVPYSALFTIHRIATMAASRSNNESDPIAGSLRRKITGIRRKFVSPFMNTGSAYY